MASPLATILAGQPPAQNMPTPTVGPTDVQGAYRDSYNAQMEKYKADTAKNNAMWGGLAGLGGSLLGGALLGPMGGMLGKSIGGAFSSPSPASSGDFTFAGG